MEKRLLSILLILSVLVGCHAVSPSGATPAVPTDDTLSSVTSVVTAPVVQTADTLPETETDPIESTVESTTVSPPASTASKVTDNISSKPASKPNKKPTSSAAESSKPASSVVSTPKPQPKPVLVPDENKTDIVTYIKQPSYKSIQKEIAALAEKYPELIQAESIGTSVQGRDLTLLKLGKGKAEACVVGGIHAREGITTTYTMRCIEEMCVAYESKSGTYAGYDIKKLLDRYTLYIVPLSNPDGLEIVSGRAEPEVEVSYLPMQYSGETATLGDYKGNANGVNLNKNFPLSWKKLDTKVYAPDAENYKGPSASSEPETKALIQLCRSHDFMWMTSIHVKGDCVYWSDARNPSVGKSAVIAEQLENLGFYPCETTKSVSGYGGGFENWFREEFKKPGFCLELVPVSQTIDPTTNRNHKYFSNTVRFATTKAALPVIMQYGYID